jgi:hypothetical protein
MNARRRLAPGFVRAVARTADRAAAVWHELDVSPAQERAFRARLARLGRDVASGRLTVARAQKQRAQVVAEIVFGREARP